MGVAVTLAEAPEGMPGDDEPDSDPLGAPEADPDGAGGPDSEPKPLPGIPDEREPPSSG
jgi:hypothetical protein